MHSQVVAQGTEHLEPETTMEMDNFTNCMRSLVEDFNSSSDIFALVAPADDVSHWSERTAAWYAFFYIMLVVFGFLFLCLAVMCLMLMVKRHLAQRFKVRTFIAIDVSLIVLGVSRVLFLIIDPWGQSGFGMGHTAWMIVSRLLAALAFPSLTASYTLVFITLWMSARIQLGKSSYQRFKVLIPLCFIHYFVAIAFEIIGFIPWHRSNAIVVTFLLIGCEAVFSLWGFLVCFSYLFAGCRLLKSVEASARSSSVICRDSPNLNRHQLIEKSKFQNQKSRARTRSTLKLKHMVREHHRRAIRKVSIIMYLTAILGMLYSFLSLTNLTLVVLSIFEGCPGFLTGMEEQHPGVWLLLRYVSFSLEFLLALLLTYSIADYRPVLIFIKGCVRACCGLGKVGARKQSPEIALANSSVQTVETPRSPDLAKDSPSALKTRNGSASPTAASVRFVFDGNRVEGTNNMSIDSETKLSLESGEEEFEIPLQNSGPPSPSSAHRDTIQTPPQSPLLNSHSVHNEHTHAPSNPSPLTVSFSLEV